MILRYSINLKKNSRNFFIQSEVESKPIATRLHAFSHALRQLHVIYFDFWLVHLIVFVFFDWLEWLVSFWLLRHSMNSRSIPLIPVVKLNDFPPRYPVNIAYPIKPDPLPPSIFCTPLIFNLNIPYTGCLGKKFTYTKNPQQSLIVTFSLSLQLVSPDDLVNAAKIFSSVNMPLK